MNFFLFQGKEESAPEETAAVTSFPCLPKFLFFFKSLANFSFVLRPLPSLKKIMAFQNFVEVECL